MSSTYSTNLRTELIGTGDQAGTWGGTTNTTLGSILEQAIAGVSGGPYVGGAYPVVNFPTDADITLTANNGSVDQSRSAVLVVTSTGSLTATRNVIAPASASKIYIIKNSTTGGQSIQIKYATGTGVTIANGAIVLVYGDGTNYNLVSNPNSITGNLTVSGTVSATQYTSTIATGTAPFVVTSTTPVANLSIGGNAATATSATSATSATTATSATNATNVISGGTIASNVTATTQTAGDNSTKVATTAYVATAVSGVALLPGILGQAFTSNGTFTIPSGVTAVKVTVIGGGGGGKGNSGYLVGGNNGGTSQISSGTQSITTVSASGGSGANNSNNFGGGLGSNGDLNIRGGYSSPGYAGGIGGLTILGVNYGGGGYGGVIYGPCCSSTPQGGGGGGGAAIKYLTGLTSGNTISVTIGGGGAADPNGGGAQAGFSGIVLFEW